MRRSNNQLGITPSNLNLDQNQLAILIAEGFYNDLLDATFIASEDRHHFT